MASSYSLLPLLLVGLLAGCPPSGTPAPTRTVQGPPTSELIAWLTDPGDADDGRKRFAATLLGMRGDPDGLPALRGCVTDERSPWVRAAAVESLGLMADAKAGPTLRAALQDRDPRVRLEAARALARVAGPENTKALEEVASRRSSEGRAAVLALAAGLGADRRDALGRLDLSDPGRFEHPLVVQQTTPGRVWYVDASAGDDAASGDQDRPFRTIGAAVARMAGGEWIQATAGEQETAFREHVVIPRDKGGSLPAPTRLAAWPGRPPPVLEGFAGDDRDAPGPGIGIQVEGAYVRVEGWTVRGYDESGIHLGGEYDAAIDCTVEACERHGIFAYYAPHATIVGAKVRDCAAQGISLRTSPFSVVADSRSDDNGIDGLLLLQDSDGVTISGFSASGNQRGIGLVGRSNAARLIHVDVRGNRGEAVGVDAGCDVLEFDVRREDGAP